MKQPVQVFTRGRLLVLAVMGMLAGPAWAWGPNPGAAVEAAMRAAAEAAAAAAADAAAAEGAVEAAMRAAEEAAAAADAARRQAWVIKETDIQLTVPVKADNLSRAVAKVCAKCTVTADNYLTLPGVNTHFDNAKTQQACVGTVGTAVDATVTLAFHWGPPNSSVVAPDGASAPFTFVCDLLLENRDGSVANPARGGPAWSAPDTGKPLNLKSRGTF